ncbi:hypothetical protein [Microbispora sp. NPDC046933]|uniref:hypothetical protein n=1 Tax=Microbispora sp. NPDC046933 TaxID=3155618 RepID=UPI0033DD6109
MRWRVTMAAVLGIAAIPVPARAASVDVVAAVRRLQAQGSPVKVFQHTSVAWPRDPRFDEMPRGYCKGGSDDPHVTGMARLGRGGVVAADMKRSMPFGNCRLRFLREDAAGGDRRAGDLAQVGSATHRVRSVGGVLYGAGPAYGGTSWARMGKASGGAALYGDQIVDAFDLGTLTALVASASSSRPGSAVHDADDRAIKKTWGYRGTTTFGKLFEISKPFRTMLGGRLDPRFSGITVFWGIATDMTGKPIVVQAVWRPGKGYPAESVAVSTRFSWDVKASITAPRTGRAARDPYGDDVVDLYRS